MSQPLGPDDLDLLDSLDGLPQNDRAENCDASEPIGGRPEIQITTRLHENVDAAIRALRADRNLYQRGGKLQHVTRTTRQESEESGVAILEGTPQIRPVALATLTEKCARHATFTRYRPGRRKDDADGEWVPALPTKSIVAAVDARGEWRGIRDLKGVIEAPGMRPDGSVIQVPGYDAATGFLYAPSIAFPSVPEEPTQADAARALRELCEILIDFPFVSEAARMVPIAALLSLVLRPAIRGAVPAFLFDAPTPGTGKSLCADAVCTVATGRSAPRGTFPITNRGKVNVEELEKILGSYALASAAVIGFDNLAGAFGGAPIDKVLTAGDTVDLRVLGQSVSCTARWVAVVLVSGNNVAVLDDTVRRVLICRIESNEERPEDRKIFLHSPLLSWVEAERPRLVVDALTIARAFVLAGRPACDVDPLGSFEPWSELVARSIVFAGGANVLDARAGAEQLTADDGRGELRAIMDGWERMQGDLPGLTAKTALDALYPSDRRRGEATPDEFDGMRGAVEALCDGPPGQVPSPKALGAQLRRFKGRIIGSRRLVPKLSRVGVTLWRVVRLDDRGGAE